MVKTTITRSKSRAKAKTLGYVRRAKPKKSAPEPEIQFVRMERQQFYGLLSRLDERVTAALAGYGTLRTRVPFTYVPPIPETLADISLDIQILRHMAEAVTS